MSYEDQLIREATGEGPQPKEFNPFGFFEDKTPVETNDSTETGVVRRFKFGKYGLAENALGKHVALDWKGRRLLGEVTDAQYNATRGYIMLTVKHFNGESWPIQPTASAVEIIG